MIATLTKEIKAHGSLNSDDLGEIYQLIKYKDYIVSLALDNGLKIWDRNLELVSSHTIHGYYQISLAQYQDRFYIGDGNGNIRVYNDKIQLIETIKICNDYISDIKIFKGLLLTVAFDGTIVLIDLVSKQRKQVNVQAQLYSSQAYGDSYYIAGTKTYKISKDLTVVEQIAKYHRFLNAKDQLYGLKDTGVFSLVNKSSNPIDQQAYDSFVEVGNHIIAITENKITAFWSPFSTYICWKTQYVPQFKEGYQKRAVLAFGNQIFVGSDEGKIYKMVLNDL